MDKVPKNKQKIQDLTKENKSDILTMFPKGGIKIYEKTRTRITVNHEDYSH